MLRQAPKCLDFFRYPGQPVLLKRYLGDTLCGRDYLYRSGLGMYSLRLIRFITSSGSFATGGKSFLKGFAVASMPTLVRTPSSRADISRSVPRTPGRIMTS